MGNLLPSLGRRKLPMLDMPKVGGAGFLRFLGSVSRTAAGVYSDPVPKGASECVALVRAGGGGGYGSLPGGGAAEEPVAFAVAPGQVVTSTIGAGGLGERANSTGNGETSSIAYQGKTLVTADGGKAGGISGAGGVASASGISGSAGNSSTLAGGAAGSFTIPSPGGTYGGSGTGIARPGTFGSGGAGNGDGGISAAAGGAGVVVLFFYGP